MKKIIPVAVIVTKKYDLDFRSLELSTVASDATLVCAVFGGDCDTSTFETTLGVET